MHYGIKGKKMPPTSGFKEKELNKRKYLIKIPATALNTPFPFFFLFFFSFPTYKCTKTWVCSSSYTKTVYFHFFKNNKESKINIKSIIKEEKIKDF